MSDRINIAFGRVFKRLRLERGWTHVSVNADFCFGRRYLCDVEHGKRNVSLDFIVKTANMFGLTVYELIEMVEQEDMKLPTL